MKNAIFEFVKNSAKEVRELKSWVLACLVWLVYVENIFNVKTVHKVLNLNRRTVFYRQPFHFGNLFISQVIRKGKYVLPTLARLCLIATFLEDGLRMYFQWNEQREYMDMSWGCGKVTIFRSAQKNCFISIIFLPHVQFLATVFVIINLFGQLGGCIMVMGRLKVEIACGLLFFIVVLQVSTKFTQSFLT